MMTEGVLKIASNNSYLPPYGDLSTARSRQDLLFRRANKSVMTVVSESCQQMQNDRMLLRFNVSQIANRF